ncbi:MAG: rhodanese-like domain-containing protein [SAR324 cluster bacterium]|nr:rhodanese-like domain-containing protein [SAR324 cluster bacterium]
MPKTVSPAEVKAMLSDGEELALLDVREQGRFFLDGHLFFASSLPLSALELRIADMVPRLDTRIVLCDGGEGLAGRAAARLGELGYKGARVLAGGSAGWRDAGYEVFTGFNVPSKAFGEFVEVQYHTPSVSAEELQEMMDKGEPLVVLDSRPMDEFRKMSIPTGIDVPGAELAYRVSMLAPAPDTTVVVNCAGRTRSIIGAQSLINAGIPNKVVALRNGTMGWHLAGLELEHGANRAATEPTEACLAEALAIKSRVEVRFGVREIDMATLEQWRRDDTGTVYVLDVRHPEEFEAGHLAGSRSAPGGQLVQATDVYIGTRNARVVLVDDNGVRATMTASWLIQMGWEQVRVLKDGLAGVLEEGPHVPHVPGLDAVHAEEISPEELSSSLEDASTAVLDLGYSRDYLQGHLPGAWFAIRSQLAETFSQLPPADTVVLTSLDGLAARLAAPEVAALTEGAVKVLSGGTRAWQTAGLPMTEGVENALAGLDDDALLKPYDHDKGVEDAMRLYLSWEINLVAQVKRDGDARFKHFPA